jgi:hypothetical protein
MSTATLLSLAALLCACALIRCDVITTTCQQNCGAACAHYWPARDLSCHTACAAVCAPTPGVAAPCVVAGGEQGGSSEGGMRGASNHAACMRLCSVGCGAVLNRDVCRNVCLRFTHPK